MFPAGSRVIRDPHGTAPGIDMDVPREGRPPCHVFVLPGVPAEMFEMWNDSVAPAIRGLPGPRRVIRRRKIHCFGAGESQIESMLPDLIRRGRQPTVGITASKATITLRIAAEGDSEAQCEAAIEPVAATIRQCLGMLVFGEEDDELQHAVLRQLRERGQTLATVEWGTAGMVADWLGHVEKAVDDAAGAFVGGLTVADEVACRNVLGMPADVARVDSDAEGFVRAMAAACRGGLPPTTAWRLARFLKLVRRSTRLARFISPWQLPTAHRPRKSPSACIRPCCTSIVRSRRRISCDWQSSEAEPP